MLQYPIHIQCFTLVTPWHPSGAVIWIWKVWVQILWVFVCVLGKEGDVSGVVRLTQRRKAWHDTENSAMYSTQCISVNVQCTSNTIQPESRIKKVETQQKKKKEKKNCYKWQSPEALFARRRKHHAEAIERNKSLCDRRPTCPTALLLVLHITKSHVAITTYLHVSPGYLSHISFAVRNLPSSRPLSHLTLSLSSVYFLLFPSFTSFSFIMSVSPTLCIQRRPGAGGLSVCWTF